MTATKPGVNTKRRSGREGLFEAIFSAMPDPAILVDSQGTVLSTSTSFEEVLGSGKDEVVGKSILGLEFLPEDLKQYIRENMERRMRGEEVLPYETYLTTREGVGLNIELSTTLLEHQGEVLTMFILRNITQREQAEELYQTLANNSPVGVYIIQDGRVQFANPQFQKYTGYTEDELEGMNTLNIVHPQDRERVRQNAVDMLKGKHPSSYEFRYISKSGEIIWAMETTTPIHYKGKRATLGNFMDITERKQAEDALRESEQLYLAMANSAQIGVYIIQDGKYVFVNQRFQEGTGYTEDELLNSEPGAIIHPDDREMVREKTVSMLKGELHTPYEFRSIIKNGEERVTLQTVTSVQYKGKRAYMGCYMDITERKRMEQQLEQKVEELEAAYEKLQELDKLKDNFLSTVSHELRTPLTSIKSFSEILLSYDEDEKTRKEFLGIINEESDRLTRLINNFLDLSKIEAGWMQWETAELSLPSVIQTAVNATQALADQMNLRVDIDLEPDLPAVRCDRDRLVQVVTNLLSNAIKFTPEGGVIRVSAQIPEDSESAGGYDMVVVGVSDTGIGIASEDHESIFEKFKQVGDTLTDKPQGSGLGLPICKEIIEHYEGRIWVESQPGKGSTFFFTLPSVKKTEAKVVEARGEPVEIVSGGGKTILVVDDEANIRRFLQHELTKKGYRVLTASGGKEAISLVREYHPNLITLDVLMPDIDGFDVTAVLKNDPGVKDIPILIISVFEDKEKAYKLGANDYVTKPFIIDMLIDKVDRLLLDAKKEILVVDDDKALVRSLKYELDMRGYSTHVAYNGKEALEVVEKHPPDLILLDIKMPEMDGYEVIKALKCKPNTAKIHIVLMTGVEIDGGRVKALSLGAAEYFTKSGGFDKMFKTIENILGSKSSL